MQVSNTVNREHLKSCERGKAAVRNEAQASGEASAVCPAPARRNEEGRAGCSRRSGLCGPIVNDAMVKKKRSGRDEKGEYNMTQPHRGVSA